MDRLLCDRGDDGALIWAGGYYAQESSTQVPSLLLHCFYPPLYHVLERVKIHTAIRGTVPHHAVK